MEQQQANNEPILCSTGCGFFANYGSAGMCSKCFREHQQREQSEQQKQHTPEVKVVAQPLPLAVQPPAAAVSEPAATPAAAAAAAALPAEAPAAASPAAEAASPAEPRTSTRCQKCRKKVGLTGFKCKCGLLFCGQHRYAEAHDCDYDYKTSQRERLAAANPLVQAAKVERI